MSLDRWLGKDLTNKLLTPPNSDDCCLRKTQVKPRHVSARPLRKNQLYRMKRGIKPDQTLTAMRQLQFLELDTVALDTPGNIVSGLAHHDVLCAGSRGEILLFDSKHHCYGEIRLLYDPVIRDMTCLETEVVVCTDDSVMFCDIKQQKYTGKLITDEKVFGFQNISVLEGADLAVTGTKSGSAYICDLRQRAITSTIWDAHDPHRRARLCQTTRGPSISAVEWCNDKTVATASTQDQTVKFWDLRKHSVPVNEVAMIQRAPIGGIASLCRDQEQKIWALGRNGAVESMLVTQELPIDTFGYVDVASYGASLTVIDDPTFATPLIAAASTNAVTIMNRPRLEQAYDYSNKMVSHQLLCPTGSSSLFWHQYSKNLVAAGNNSEDCYFWSNRRDIY